MNSISYGLDLPIQRAESVLSLIGKYVIFQNRDTASVFQEVLGISHIHSIHIKTH